MFWVAAYIVCNTVILYDEKYIPDIRKHVLLKSSVFGSTYHYKQFNENHQI
jgi:hypothetical protein